MRLGEEALEVVGGGGRRCLARARKRARGITRGEVQLVERDQHRLREVQRGVRRGRDRDGGVNAIEDLVRQPAVLAAEHEADPSVLDVLERVVRRGARVEDLPFRGTPARGEAEQAHAVGDGGVEVVVVGDAVDHVPRVVRDPLETHGIVLARPDESQGRHAHVLHRAHRGGDVHRILGLVEHHGDAGEARLVHAER